METRCDAGLHLGDLGPDLGELRVDRGPVGLRRGDHAPRAAGGGLAAGRGERRFRAWPHRSPPATLAMRLGRQAALQPAQFESQCGGGPPSRWRSRSPKGQRTLRRSVAAPPMTKALTASETINAPTSQRCAIGRRTVHSMLVSSGSKISGSRTTTSTVRWLGKADHARVDDAADAGGQDDGGGSGHPARAARPAAASRHDRSVDPVDRSGGTDLFIQHIAGGGEAAGERPAAVEIGAEIAIGECRFRARSPGRDPASAQSRHRMHRSPRSGRHDGRRDRCSWRSSFVFFRGSQTRQMTAGPGEKRFVGAFADPHDGGRLGLAQVLEVTEHQRLALPLRQAGERRLDGVAPPRSRMRRASALGASSSSSASTVSMSTDGRRRRNCRGRGDRRPDAARSKSGPRAARPAPAARAGETPPGRSRRPRPGSPGGASGRNGGGAGQLAEKPGEGGLVCPRQSRHQTPDRSECARGPAGLPIAPLWLSREHRRPRTRQTGSARR